MSRSDFYANQVESEVHLNFAAEEFAAEKSLAAESLLIRALVQEIHTAAQLTAGTASAINMTEPPRVCWRLFGLSQAAIFSSSRAA